VKRAFAGAAALRLFCGLLSADEVPLGRLYPDDAGLARDPAVLFADDFESGDWRKWNETHGAVGATTDAPHAGRHCARIETAPGPHAGGFAFRRLTPGADRVFTRFYVKFSARFQYADHLAWLCGHVFGDPQRSFGRAGERPDGSYFTSGLAPFFARGKNPPPGEVALCAFYPDMPAEPRTPGQFAGHYFFPPGPGPGTAAAPGRIVPPLERWQCWEFMVQANSAPDRADGRQALWVDGRLAGEFTGLRWRGRDDVKINCLWLEHFGHSGGEAVKTHSPLEQTVWFDDVVVATRSIGPRVRR